MKLKIAVMAIVAIEVIAAVGIVVMENNDEGDDMSVSLIARANVAGSGIYIKEGLNVNDFVTFDGSNASVPDDKKANWVGKIIGTPGLSSIQHMQMKQIVNDMGYKFEAFNGITTGSGTVYYIDKVANAAAADNINIDMGILWEPQYSMIVESAKYKQLALTSAFFGNHTCCVIAASDLYLQSHPYQTVDFLMAYMQAIDYISEAMDGDTEKYNNLVRLMKANVIGGTVSDAVIDRSLENVKFVYSDAKGTADLNALKTDVANLATNLYDLGQISKSVKDNGFANAQEFADALVDNSYLQKAVDGEASRIGGTIDVCTITGDMHTRLALYVAKDQGYFSDYNLVVNVKDTSPGGMVATDLLTGHSDLAFLGAPPLTSAAIVGNYVAKEGSA